MENHFLAQAPPLLPVEMTTRRESMKEPRNISSPQAFPLHTNILIPVLIDWGSLNSPYACFANRILRLLSAGLFCGLVVCPRKKGAVIGKAMVSQ